MKKNLSAKTPQAVTQGQTREDQRRINAGWLRLWKAVYPNTPPPGVVQSLKSKVQSRGAEGRRLESKVLSLKSKVCGGESKVHGRRSKVQHASARRPAAVGYLSRFLGVWLALALLATPGCAGPRPLKGGKAVTTHKPAGVIEQTLVQGENASQATRQDQGSVKVRTYTLPAGSRIEEPQLPGNPTTRGASLTRDSQPSILNSQLSADNPQPSTAFILSAPMPVVEREETHARTELGAAQKDTARELGAKLSSLKGIVWVGAGLFVFGLASLVWPPLKVVIGSVTTSAALMLGGVALMVLPTMVVGNELLILGGVAVAVGGWFLAHRHGQLRGMVAASSERPTPRS